MDERLRELERCWRATGDPASEGQWLAALVQAGRLGRPRLELAAWLGHPGAVAAAPEAAEPTEEPDRWSRLERWAVELDRQLSAHPAASHRAVLAEAERLLEGLDALPLNDEIPYLLVIDGREAGRRQSLATPVGVREGRDGPRLVPAARADVAVFELREGRAVLRVCASALQEVTVEEEQGERLGPGASRVLGQVAMITTGTGQLCYYRNDRESERSTRDHLRRWLRWLLDELAACVVAGGPSARRQGLLSAQQVLHQLRSSPDPRVRWLRRKVRRLSRRLERGTPVELAGDWPVGPERDACPEWPDELRACLREALVPLLLGRGDPLRARAAGALERLRPASSCGLAKELFPADYENDPTAEAPSLVGLGRVRTCNACYQRVYDLSGLGPEEASALIAAHEQRRLCVNLYRREDGLVMAQECPGRPVD